MMESHAYHNSPTALLFDNPPEFSAFLITIELRTASTLTLEDPASQYHRIRITILLHDQYEKLPSDRIRPSHLSWAKFQDQIHRLCRFPLDLNTCELGFRSQTLQQDQYFKISSELTFQNALAVMFNDWKASQSILSLHLWNPKPTVPVLPKASTATSKAPTTALTFPPSRPRQHTVVENIDLATSPDVARLSPAFSNPDLLEDAALVTFPITPNPFITVVSDTTSSIPASPLLHDSDDEMPDVLAPTTPSVDDPSALEEDGRIRNKSGKKKRKCYQENSDSESEFNPPSHDASEEESVEQEDIVNSDSDHEVFKALKRGPVVDGPWSGDSLDLSDVDSGGGTAVEGVEYDASLLLQHLPAETMRMPEEDDFASTEEYDNQMIKYLDYLRRRELSRWVQTSPPSSLCLG